MGYNSVLKGNEPRGHENPYRKLKFKLLGERRQSEKVTQCAISI